jgi:hypothetical protein
MRKEQLQGYGKFTMHVHTDEGNLTASWRIRGKDISYKKSL